MKIKKKKQLTLPQLIEWAMENDIKDTVFLTKAYSVGFDIHGFIYFNSSTTIPLDTMFTVEVDEEITEDTEFKRLVCINDNDKTVAFSNFTIRELKDIGIKEFHAYIDGEFRCLWRNGKLVE